MLEHANEIVDLDLVGHGWVKLATLVNQGLFVDLFRRFSHLFGHFGEERLRLHTFQILETSCASILISTISSSSLLILIVAFIFMLLAIVHSDAPLHARNQVFDVDGDSLSKLLQKHVLIHVGHAKFAQNCPQIGQLNKLLLVSLLLEHANGVDHGAENSLIC